MIHRSPLPDVEIPAEYVSNYVLARADELGDKPAIIDGPSGRALTYSALLRRVRALAGGLVAGGFEPGQTLALIAPNLPEYAVVFHGVAVRGRHGHHDQPDLHRSARFTTSSSTPAPACWSRSGRSSTWPRRPLEGTDVDGDPRDRPRRGSATRWRLAR